jgi:hypothetical protein
MAGQLFVDGVLAEPGDGAQAAGAGGPGAAAGLQVAGEAFDAGAAGLEQTDVTQLAPAGVLAQVQRMRLAGQAGAAGQESSQGQLLRLGEHWLDGGDCRGCGCGGHGALPGSG